MGQIDKWVIVFLALPISPIGRIGLISPIFNALWVGYRFQYPAVGVGKGVKGVRGVRGN